MILILNYMHKLHSIFQIQEKCRSAMALLHYYTCSPKMDLVA